MFFYIHNPSLDLEAAAYIMNVHHSLVRGDEWSVVMLPAHKTQTSNRTWCPYLHFSWNNEKQRACQYRGCIPAESFLPALPNSHSQNRTSPPNVTVPATKRRRISLQLPSYSFFPGACYSALQFYITALLWWSGVVEGRGGWSEVSFLGPRELIYM